MKSVRTGRTECMTGVADLRRGNTNVATHKAGQCVFLGAAETVHVVIDERHVLTGWVAIGLRHIFNTVIAEILGLRHNARL